MHSTMSSDLTSPSSTPSTTTPTKRDLVRQFEAERGRLLRCAYGMLGVVEDAEDMVQESFVRLLRRPPDDDTRPLRPWLMRVVVNLCKDNLRRRRLKAYPGPWLPVPVSDVVMQDDGDWLLVDQDTPEGHFATWEQASLGYLLALEALSPGVRAAWVLGEVLGYDGPDCAAILDVTPAALRQQLARARKQLQPLTAEPQAREPMRMRALSQLLAAVADDDVDKLRALLHAQVTAFNDGGGEVSAARNVVTGPDAVARLLVGLAHKSKGASLAVHQVGRQWMVRFHLPLRGKNTAPMSWLSVDVDDDGRITQVFTLLAPSKVRQIRL